MGNYYFLHNFYILFSPRAVCVSFNMETLPVNDSSQICEQDIAFKS